MQREDALHTLTKGDLPHSERRAEAAAVQADHDAFEDLDALLVALAHLYVHAHGVSRLHVRPFGQLRLLDRLNRVHDSVSFLISSSRARSSSSSGARSSNSGR